MLTTGFFLLLSMTCSLQAENYKTLYDFKSLAKLQAMLNSMKNNPSETQIEPLVALLRLHWDKILNADYGLGKANNIYAALELYGDAARAIEQTMVSYFTSYGQSDPYVPDDLLTEILEGLIHSDNGPFVARGFAEDFARSSRPLFIELPRETDGSSIIKRLQSLVPFPVRSVTEEGIQKILENNDSVAVIDISQTIRFKNIVYIHFWLKFVNKDGISNTANATMDLFFEESEGKLILLNGVPFS